MSPLPIVDPFATLTRTPPSRFETAEFLYTYLLLEGHHGVYVSKWDYDHSISVRYRNKETHEPLQIIVQEVIRDDDGFCRGINNQEEAIIKFLKAPNLHNKEHELDHT